MNHMLFHRARTVHNPGVTGTLKFALPSVLVMAKRWLVLITAICEYGSAGKAGLALSTRAPDRVVVPAIKFRFIVTVALGDRSCLSRLPHKVAQVFRLREIDDVSSEEICKDLGVSPNNLWVMLHRARMGLRRCLEVHWFGNKQQDE
jgi:hypothetical protein